LTGCKGGLGIEEIGELLFGTPDTVGVGQQVFQKPGIELVTHDPTRVVHELANGYTGRIRQTFEPCLGAQIPADRCLEVEGAFGYELQRHRPEKGLADTTRRHTVGGGEGNTAIPIPNPGRDRDQSAVGQAHGNVGAGEGTGGVNRIEIRLQPGGQGLDPLGRQNRGVLCGQRCRPEQTEEKDQAGADSLAPADTWWARSVDHISDPPRTLYDVARDDTGNRDIPAAGMVLPGGQGRNMYSLAMPRDGGSG